MMLNRFRKQPSAHAGFTISDHVDWECSQLGSERMSGRKHLAHARLYNSKWCLLKDLKDQGKNVKDLGNHFAVKTVEILEEED